ncbi:hypothetical protein BPOR_1190g00030 [Botrytis porri]|uniref:Uncharacterized protein n=1 Tax=Botrytis porri TaxID=87229 RepID=A0A4Z1KB33_9HELO|nr:hypothetical protein BPOR_1190g00030 [Botrytis porri]
MSTLIILDNHFPAMVADKIDQIIYQELPKLLLLDWLQYFDRLKNPEVLSFLKGVNLWRSILDVYQDNNVIEVTKKLRHYKAYFIAMYSGWTILKRSPQAFLSDIYNRRYTIISARIESKSWNQIAV